MGADSRRAVFIVALAELFGTSLWFSVNAVADALQRDWHISLLDVGHFTSAVQLGFICGTLLISLSGFADRYSASRIFAGAALLGAASNAAFALCAGQLTAALLLRFVTGVSLAGVYPIGMKLVVSWAPQRMGRALAWLVGMLVLGTGLPHLIRGVNISPEWQGVVYAASGLAVVAGAVIWWLGDGPYHGTAERMHWRDAVTAFSAPHFRRVAIGYFGHNWELYGFWALVPVLIAQAADGEPSHHDYLLAFSVFAIGAIGCFVGGVASARWGSGRIAIVALLGSAAACALYPFCQDLPYPLLLALLLFWGLFVVTDSPQFSALVAVACEPDRIGTRLALMNSVSFALTIGSIELVTGAWSRIGVWVAWILLPGPVFGLFAMRKLWREPAASPTGDRSALEGTSRAQ